MKNFKTGWEELQHLKAVFLPARDLVVISVNSCGKLEDVAYVPKGQRPQAKYVGGNPMGGIVYVARECALTFSARAVWKNPFPYLTWDSCRNNLFRNETWLWKDSHGMYTAKSCSRVSVGIWEDHYGNKKIYHVIFFKYFWPKTQFFTEKNKTNKFIVCGWHFMTQSM